MEGCRGGKTDAAGYCRKKGTIRGITVAISSVRAAALPVADDRDVELARLRTELAAARARIAELEARADVDPLLEILNRRGFERVLGRALAFVERYGTAAAVVYLDLDHFKSVNDRHGHAAGDALLRSVAAVLARHVRASDVVARLGGDEFAVLMWNVDAGQAESKARELEAAIASTRIEQAGAALSVAVSAGAAVLGAGVTPDAVIDAADRAMYARKRERRDAQAMMSGVS
jgi:diguanylate cyclase (GGDEF)-like protein